MYCEKIHPISVIELILQKCYTITKRENVNVKE